MFSWEWISLGALCRWDFWEPIRRPSLSGSAGLSLSLIRGACPSPGMEVGVDLDEIRAVGVINARALDKGADWGAEPVHTRELCAEPPGRWRPDFRRAEDDRQSAGKIFALPGSARSMAEMPRQTSCCRSQGVRRRETL